MHCAASGSSSIHLWTGNDVARFAMLRLAADLRESAHGARLMVTAQPQRCYASPTSETALSCGRSSTPQSAGLSVNETKHEISVEVAIRSTCARKSRGPDFILRN
jgi:hypothetical protein